MLKKYIHTFSPQNHSEVFLDDPGGPRHPRLACVWHKHTDSSGEGDILLMLVKCFMLNDSVMEKHKNIQA